MRVKGNEGMETGEEEEGIRGYVGEGWSKRDRKEERETEWRTIQGAAGGCPESAGLPGCCW